jgi:hypothetical protein
MQEKLPTILKLFSVISHNGGKSPLLYPTMEENLLRCIPQHRKTSSVVSHNARHAAALYPTTAKNFFKI